ncbi:hypothetical protein DDB_G0285757 [Dictyostelium discoideum AX4]|uniref:Uncharacterized protein n=1 Tax=Dictyostelium discoideum TaxID=44689 RepID=Q54N04_DICDI|nr:hypothetical protein DDB_G0285757 [Dictyostelium discoideum AX4]EAL64716.1 hypothetical protein DDB_G0285757 [Dictyostelium discoideum AX4]|eukprot:XP_638139.1 hypothetical protein DDB_G0285757 [Dictyostelium discoideum AX4]
MITTTTIIITSITVPTTTITLIEASVNSSLKICSTLFNPPK